MSCAPRRAASQSSPRPTEPSRLPRWPQWRTPARTQMPRPSRARLCCLKKIAERADERACGRGRGGRGQRAGCPPARDDRCRHDRGRRARASSSRRVSLSLSSASAARLSLCPPLIYFGSELRPSNHHCTVLQALQPNERERRRDGESRKRERESDSSRPAAVAAAAATDVVAVAVVLSSDE